MKLQVTVISATMTRMLTPEFPNRIVPHRSRHVHASGLPDRDGHSTTACGLKPTRYGISALPQGRPCTKSVTCTRCLRIFGVVTKNAKKAGLTS